MVVIRTQERVDEQSAVEPVPVGTVVQQLLDVPVQAFDRDTAVGADLQLAAVGAVGRANDDARIGDGGDGPESGLDGTGEPVVEIAPAAPGLNVLLHVVRRRFPKRLDFGNGSRFVEPLAELLGILIDPVGEPGVADVDRCGLDGILEVLDAGLVEDEVEEADAVVDVAAFFILPGDPVEPFVDFGQVLGDRGDVFHFDYAAVVSVFDGGLEAMLPS